MSASPVLQAALNTPAHPPIAEAMTPWQLFFGLRGRVSRRTFWGYGFFGMAGLGILLGALANIAGFRGERVEELVNLVLVWPFAAISVKRWHDRDHSGWWVFVALVPVIGTLWLLIANGALPTKPGPNRFGPAPDAHRWTAGR